MLILSTYDKHDFQL